MDVTPEHPLSLGNRGRSTDRTLGRVSLHSCLARRNRGSLCYGAGVTASPSKLKRTFWCSTSRAKVVREHAHRNKHQFLACISGQCHWSPTTAGAHEFISIPSQGRSYPACLGNSSRSPRRVLLVLGLDTMIPRITFAIMRNSGAPRSRMIGLTTSAGNGRIRAPDLEAAFF